MNKKSRQSGMSMIEVMMMTAMMAALAVGGMKMMNSQLNNTKKIQEKFERQSTANTECC
jgi:type II secretory pathway pseudopilin PulG